MLKLLIVMAFTTFGLLIILKFIKPSEREIKAMKELDKAQKDLRDDVLKAFKVPEITRWLNGRFKKL